MSIIFALDTDLKVYLVSTVKPDLVLLKHLERNTQGLQLTTFFEAIWQELWQNYLQSATSLYLLIGNRASFTDTRVIAIWLRSWQDIWQDTDQHFISIQKGNLETFDWQNLQNNDQARQEIDYSQAPKIGGSV